MEKLKRPNIIFLFADQLNYSSCGFSGESRALTPHIDKIAREGAQFRQATSCNPLCGPFRSSLFTGKHTATTGHFRNNVRCLPDDEAIGHVLDRAGYRTGYIGKWHLYCRTGDEQFTPPGPYRLGFDQYFASYNWNHDYWNGFYYLDVDKRLPMEGYQTDFQTDMALDFLDSVAPGDDPFALFVSYELPHPPCREPHVPAEYYEHFRNIDFSDLLYSTKEVFEEFEPSFDSEWQQREVIDAHQERCRTYFAMTECLDSNIGRILKRIDESGMKDDTIIVFTSDHGDMLGGHGRVQKRIFYDESARVPFILSWPGTVESGTVLDEPFSTPDIAATLTDLCGLKIPAGYEGHSYAPLLSGVSGIPSSPEFAYISSLHCGKFNHREEFRAVRSNQYLYAKMTRNGKEFLFDHRSDPKQLENLLADPEHADMLEWCRKELIRQMKQLGDDPKPWEWYQEHWQKDGFVLSLEERRRK